MLTWLAGVAEEIGAVTLLLAIMYTLFFSAGKLGRAIAGRDPLTAPQEPAKAVSVLDWGDYTPELDWYLVANLEEEVYGKAFEHDRSHEKNPPEGPYRESMGISREEYEHIIRKGYSWNRD